MPSPFKVYRRILNFKNLFRETQFRTAPIRNKTKVADSFRYVVFQLGATAYLVKKSAEKEAENDPSWKWDGKQYAKNSTSQEERALNALRAVGLKVGDDVLDIGCGDGKITRRIAQEVYPGKVVGLDKDPSMVRQAINNIEGNNLDIIQADAVNFRLERKFKVITAFFSLQWVPEENLPQAIKNIFLHLEDNGRFCGLFPCYDFPHEAIKGVAFSDKWRQHFRDYKEPQTFFEVSFYNRLFDQSGFKDTEVEMIESVHPMTNQGFIDFTRQWCGCYMCIKDESLLQEFIKDVNNKLNAEIHDSDGKFNMIQKSIRVIAKKQKPIPRNIIEMSRGNTDTQNRI